MTITATPDATYHPPRVAVAMTLPPGSVMETVELWRKQGGTRELVRTQPVAGFDQRTVYDYEAPFEVPVSYEWQSKHLDGSSFTTAFTETWANLAAWAAANPADGAWGVSGGNLIYTGAASSVAKLTYSITAGRYRITLSSPPLGVDRVNFGEFYIDVVGRKLVCGLASVAFDPGVGAWTVNATATSVTLTTSAGNYSLAASGLVSKVEFVGANTRVSVTPSVVNLITGGVTYFALGAATDTTGRLFVLASRSDGVQELTVHTYDSSGVFVRSQLFAAGTGNGQFGSLAAAGFAIDSLNRVIIGDKFTGRIQRFSITGTGITTTLTYLDKVGTLGTGAGQFQNGDIVSITTDNANNIYVGCVLTSRVQKFTGALSFAAQWGSAGSGDSQFYNISAVASDGSNVFVLDEGRSQLNTLPRLRKFTNLGAFLWRVNADTGWNGAKVGIGVDSNGQVYVGNGDIRVYNNTTGALVKTIPTTAGSTVARIIAMTPARTAFWAFNVYWADRVALSGAVVDDVKVETYGGASNITESTNAIILAPSEAWIIHPATPAKSIPIDRDDLDKTNLETIGAVTQRSTATVHEILGQQKAIHVKTGPRRAAELVLALTTETVADRKQIEFLLADETPLLIRIPPSWGVDFDDDFYAVGDVGIERAMQLYGINARVFTLPLRAVESPIVGVENVGWSWAALAAEFASWDAVELAFVSWADLLTNNRRGS